MHTGFYEGVMPSFLGVFTKRPSCIHMYRGDVLDYKNRSSLSLGSPPVGDTCSTSLRSDYSPGWVSPPSLGVQVS